MENNPELYAMRHSLAHIMATAIVRLWPNVKLGVGPVVENGFYYDIDLGKQQLSEDEFDRIEGEMKKIIAEDQQFEHETKSIDEAIAWAKEAQQPYKLELLNDLSRAGTTVAKDLDTVELGLQADKDSKVSEVSFYRNGGFLDLCRGPHVESTGRVGAFKLMRVSGAYWRGKDTNPQMQRIYGLGFASEEELQAYIARLEEAKKRDHRRLGQELDLFVISPLVGAGLPLFTPRGTVLRDELARYSQQMLKEAGWQNVWVPHIAKQDLYEVSGHWAKFGDEWLKVESQETDDKLVMKPMNCPHHQQIYGSRQRSYRELPLKYMETTTVYRDEKAGELLGLARVRSITQDDSHTFCRPDQIHSLMSNLVEIVREFYSVLDLPLKVRLSFRDDADSYLGDQKLWDHAQQILKEVVDSAGMKYYIGEGEAAFYGPKIDFIATDALGRELQVATPQLDFVQPERFGLKYTDEDGQEKTPVMVHFALMGSIERFLAAYIEHTAGRFPVWLAPEQIRIIAVTDQDAVASFAKKLQDQANKLGLRATIDMSNESVGKKIRNAELMKVPYSVVIGEKEVESGEVQPRIRKDIEVNTDHSAHTIDEFLKTVANEAKSRATKTSL
ncbi:MAG TPA: threonine--tRNA ligase [Candidatus Saccharimonadales bacterium]|nr:threonine--tRNA ligase [Candidatus Saccharimonadales bacterium]